MKQIQDETQDKHTTTYTKVQLKNTRNIKNDHVYN
jgi:hypothetical protein